MLSGSLRGLSEALKEFLRDSHGLSKSLRGLSGSLRRSQILRGFQKALRGFQRTLRSPKGFSGALKGPQSLS